MRRRERRARTPFAGSSGPGNFFDERGSELNCVCTAPRHEGARKAARRAPARASVAARREARTAHRACVAARRRGLRCGVRVRVRGHCGRAPRKAPRRGSKGLRPQFDPRRPGEYGAGWRTPALRQRTALARAAGPGRGRRARGAGRQGRGEQWAGPGAAPGSAARRSGRGSGCARDQHCLRRPAPAAPHRHLGATPNATRPAPPPLPPSTPCPPRRAPDLAPCGDHRLAVNDRRAPPSPPRSPIGAAPPLKPWLAPARARRRASSRPRRAET
jgi:hypothetical protein